MKTPFACVFNKIWRLNSCFLKWRDCVSMKCFYCQIKITFLKRLLPWFWFLLDEEEFVMNLKLSSWTPSMLLETRYKILSTFIFVSSCGPRIRMARLTFIHPDFIFHSGDYRFISETILKGQRNVSAAFLYIYLNHIFLRISFYDHLKNTQFYE